MVGKKVDYSSQVSGSELEARLKKAADDLSEKLRAGRGKLPGIDDPRIARLRARQRGASEYGVDPEHMHKTAEKAGTAETAVDGETED